MINKIKRFILPLVGFFVGVLFFFPWNELRDILTAAIEKNAGIRITMTDFSPSTGLEMGLTRGSLFAFSGKKATIRLRSGEILACDELIIGPRFWPLLLTRAQVSLGCFNASGSFAALVSASPFWSPSAVSVSIGLDSFSLANLRTRHNLNGILSGSFEMSEMSLTENTPPKVDWDLIGKGVHTPPYQIPLLNVPALELDELKTTGSYTGRAIKIGNLEFGSATSVIEGKMTFNSDISENTGAPESGDMRGWLRVEPGAEKTSLKDIPWNIFGKPNDKGRREFKRSFTGGITTLLFAAPSAPQSE